MRDVVRFAVLGAGYMGKTHARILSQLPNVEILWVVGRTDEEVRDISKEVGAKGVTDVLLALQDPAVDAVIVAYPTSFHRELSIQALEAGKRVLCEKPIALTTDDADAMLQAAYSTALAAGYTDGNLEELASRYLMVGQVVRFWPEYAKVLEIVENGTLGRILTVELERLSTAPQWSAWFKNSAMSGGVVVDLMVHDFDIASALLGKPVTVTAYGVQTENGNWQHTKVFITYEDGRQALVIGSHLMPDSYPFTSAIRVIGEDATAEYRFVAEGTGAQRTEKAREDFLRLYNRTSISGQSPDVTIDVSSEDPYRRQLQYFVDCIRKDIPFRKGTPAQARTALAIALAAQKSMETSQSMNLLTSNGRGVPNAPEHEYPCCQPASLHRTN